MQHSGNSRIPSIKTPSLRAIAPSDPAGRGRRFWHLTTLTLVAFALAACAAVKMGYNNGDTLTLIWINRYLDLDRNQDALVHERVQAWFHWHRTTQLPDYAGLAGEIEKRVGGPVTASEVAALETQIRLRWHRLVERTLPDAADLALTLRPDQFAKMERKFASNDDKYRTDWVDISPARRNHLLFHKALDRVEYWYGPLSPEQRATLRHAVESQPVDTPLWLSERQSREKELIALLRQISEQRPPRDTVIRLLGAYVARLETSPDPRHRSYMETLDQSNRELYALVANLATPSQREHAAAKLQGWVEDFNTASKK